MAFSSSPLFRTSSATKTMEEVWKDITLQAKPSRDQDSNTLLSGIFFQDLLPASSSKEGPTSTRAITDVQFSPFPSSGKFPHLGSKAFDQEPHHECNSEAANYQLQAVGSSLGQSSYCKKRMPRSADELDHRRQKRMIKNREAAARSRARKQAYTDELELKLDHLMKENAKLLKEQRKRRLAAAALLSKKKTLCRTSTAPF